MVGGRLSLEAEAFEGAVEEVAHVEAVEVFVGELAGGVVAAGQGAGDVGDMEAAEVGEDLLGELFEEGEVPGGVDDAGLASGGDRGELLHVVGGGDAGEAVAEV